MEPDEVQGSYFSYSPLPPDHVRILNLFPGDDEHVSAELEVTALDRQPRYEALSYVWGHAHDTASVFVHGRPFAVTKNLEAALRHLRLPDAPRALWIDAACINQQDGAEVAHQIALMPDIYRTAWRVCSWLGPAPPRLSPRLGVCDVLRQLGRNKSKHFSEQCQLLGIEARIKGKFDRLVFLEDDHPILSATTMFDALQYWQRVWVILELTNAKSVVFILGSETLTLQEILGVHAWGTAHLECCATGCSLPNVIAQLALRIRAGADRDSAYIGALFTAHMKKASVSKDRFFAMRGFVSPQPQAIPDYRMPNAEISTTVARECIRASGKLAILLVAAYLRAPGSATCSWAFDLEQSETINGMQKADSVLVLRFDGYNQLDPQNRSYAADGHSKARLHPYTGSADRVSTVLGLSGIAIGTLVHAEEELSAELPDMGVAAARVSSAIQASASRLGLASRWPTADESAQHAGRIMSLDLRDMSTRATPADWPAKASDFTAAANGAADAAKVPAFAGALLVSWYFKPVVLADGAIAMVSRGVRPGDLVVVLDGSNFPFVLREVPEETQDPALHEGKALYQLVGRAYVHGIMDGEAVVDGAGQPMPRTTFFIT